MKHKSIIMIMALTYCLDSQSSEVQQSVIGCYSSRHELLYDHADLKLDKSGNYTIKTIGDLGPWGIVTGKWLQKSNKLIFKAKQKKRLKIILSPTELFVEEDASGIHLSFVINQSANTYSTEGWSIFRPEQCEL